MGREPYRIFLSHIHEERNLALKLKSIIEGCFLHAVQVFVSSHEEDVRLGDDWFQEIEMNLRRADTVILLLTPRSLQRPWVHFEAGAAWFLKKHLVPLCASGFAIDVLPPPFDRKQATDLSDVEAAKVLIREIAKRASLDAPDCDLSSIVTTSKILAKELTAEHAVPREIAPKITKQEKLSRYLSSDLLFSERLSDAFPGLSGIQEFKGDDAVKRLEVLLREPLKVDEWTDENGMVRWDHPFWWLRGRTNMHIERFQKLESNRILIYPKEMTIGRLIAVRTFDISMRDFVYVEALPDPPIGIYAYAEGEIQAKLQESLEGGYGYYVSEEYALWEGNPISRAEYDDDGTVIDGRPVRTKGAERRMRYLTPYNFVLSGNWHVLNQSGSDKETTELFDDILLAKATVEDLVNYVRDLPRPPRFDLYR